MDLEVKKKISQTLSKNNTLTDDDIIQAIALHHQNKWSIKAIAEHFNTTPKIITTRFRWHGVKIIHWNNQPKKVLQKDELKELYCTQKLSINEISKLHNISFNRIKSWLKEYGMPIRTSSETISVVNKRIIEANNGEHIFKTNEFKEQALQTKLEKYGTPFPHLMTYETKPEKELKDFLFNITGKEFYKTYIDNSEIDLYNDEYKLAIEYCGLYWHNEQSPSPKNRMYHYNKMKLCQQHGIRLITIFEDEWNYRNSQVLSFITSIISNKRNIRASKCSVIELTKNQANEFYEQYHIQGKTSNSIFYSSGLEYDGDLIGAISFSKHHRNSKDIVLSRLCFIDSLRIHGGATKLLKNSINNFEWEKIISWSDNRWSVGNVYEKMGFIKESELLPDYSYVLKSAPDKRIPKQSCKKSLIGAKECQTEKERCSELGMARIWDCGKIRWALLS